VAKIKLMNKYNFINEYGKILLKKWALRVGDFENGVAKVHTYDGIAYIDKYGMPLGGWFNDCGDFCDGFAKVRNMDKKWNFIDKNGNLLSNVWLDDCSDFYDGFAEVVLHGKILLINKNGQFLNR
jgi:hypothetical protein